jgi:hypothetical protein
MVDFLRGALVAERDELDALGYGPQRLQGFLEVDLEGGQQMTILDELQRLTEYLHLQIGTAYTFVLEPHWGGVHPVYYAPTDLPPVVGRYGEDVWWEAPLWWGGILRDVRWTPPTQWSTLASDLDPEQAWWLLETPAGAILYDPSVQLRRWPHPEGGALIVWESIRWFQLHAILP